LLIIYAVLTVMRTASRSGKSYMELRERISEVSDEDLTYVIDYLLNAY
jgi:hypothetical protein